VSSIPPDNLPLQRLLSRPVLISAFALTAAVVLAWVCLFAWEMPMSEPMAGMPEMMMPPDPWSGGALVATFTMWMLMMVAMMLPSAAPMILLHARIDRGTQAARARDNTLFALCYLLVWAGFSALAAAAQAWLTGSGLISSATLAVGGRRLSGVLLLVAAVWQLTSAKAACLEQCQSPIRFVMRFWRPGPVGAMKLGLMHGLFCLGCCWSLMLLLFIGGVMNLAWVAFIAAVVFIEKVAPPAWRIDRWLAVALALSAVAVLIA
jgi:predicted metal-binding membrane protein